MFERTVGHGREAIATGAGGGCPRLARMGKGHQGVCHYAGFLHLPPFVQLRTPGHGPMPLTFTAGFS